MQSGFSKVDLGSLTGLGGQHEWFKSDAGSYREPVEGTKLQGGMGDMGN